MSAPLFIDTWGWIVLANRKDPQHTDVVAVYQEARAGQRLLVTTDYVIDELVTFLFAKVPASKAKQFVGSVFSAVEQGQVRLVTIDTDRFARTWTMRLKYADHRNISFTDFSSFIVMRDLQIQHVLTNDHHFSKINQGFIRCP